MKSEGTGCVIGEQSAKDRRKVFLRLTERGKEVKKVHDKFHNDMIDHTIKDLRLEEDSELITALQNIQNYFRNKYEDRLETLKGPRNDNN